MYIWDASGLRLKSSDVPQLPQIKLLQMITWLLYLEHNWVERKERRYRTPWEPRRSNDINVICLSLKKCLKYHKLANDITKDDHVTLYI